MSDAWAEEKKNRVSLQEMKENTIEVSLSSIQLTVINIQWSKRYVKNVSDYRCARRNQSFKNIFSRILQRNTENIFSILKIK